MNILLVSLASAAVQINENLLTLDVDYSDFKDDNQDKITFDGQFTLNNPDPAASVVQVSFSGLPSKYQHSTVDDQTVPGNGTKTVSFLLEIPHHENAGERNIGEILISDTNSNELDRLTLRQKTKSMLVLNELTVDYKGKAGFSQRDSFDRDENRVELVEKVKSGTEINLTFEIRNLFDHDYDKDFGELQDIQLRIKVDDDDLYQNSFAEEYNLNPLAAGDDLKFKIGFAIDDDAESKEYSLDISLEAEDGKGAKHFHQLELTFNVKKAEDDVRIVKLQVTPEKITNCSELFNLEVNLKNFGTRNQREVRLGIYSSQLGIDESIAHIELSRQVGSNNLWREVFQFPLDRDYSLGLYPVDVTAFINSDEQIDTERIFLGIEECTELTATGEAEVVVGKETVLENKEQHNKSRNNKISSATIVSTVEDPYTSDDFLLGMLIVTIVLVLATIVIFSIILFK